MTLDRLHDVPRLGKLPRLQLGVDQFAVHQHLELPLVGRNEDVFGNVLLEMRQDFGRQTDGFGFVVSNRAVDDLDLHAGSFLPSRRATHGLE